MSAGTMSDALVRPFQVVLRWLTYMRVMRSLLFLTRRPLLSTSKPNLPGRSIISS